LTRRSSYTENLTQRSFYTLQTFTHREPLHTASSYTEDFTHNTLLHREAFTQKSFYTQNLLHTALHLNYTRTTTTTTTTLKLPLTTTTRRQLQLETTTTSSTDTTTTTTTTTTLQLPMPLPPHCKHNYNYSYSKLHHTTPHHNTFSSCGWDDHCNHSKKHNSNHLSVHQWIRSAIHASQQLTSPIISCLSLKLPPPPCAVRLVVLDYAMWCFIMNQLLTGIPHPVACAVQQSPQSLPETLASYSSTHNIRRFKSMDLGTLVEGFVWNIRGTPQKKRLYHLFVHSNCSLEASHSGDDKITVFLEEPNVNKP